MLNFKFSFLLILFFDFQKVDSKRTFTELKYHLNLRLKSNKEATNYCNAKQMDLLTPANMKDFGELQTWLNSWVTDSWEPDPSLVYYYETPVKVKYRYWLSPKRNSVKDPFTWPNGTDVAGWTKSSDGGDCMSFTLSLDEKKYEYSNVPCNNNYVTVCQCRSDKLLRSSDPLEECFYISQQKLSYFEAFQFCHQNGLSLVSVENYEKEYILNFALYSAGRYRRTRDSGSDADPITFRTSGNTYTTSDGHYQWILGDEMIYKPNTRKYGPPLLIKSLSNIVLINANISEEHYFICDVPKTKFFISDIEKRYYFSERKETYFIADRICQENKMQLLSIQDSDKAYDLRKHFPQDTRYWSSGLKIPKTKVWLWANSAVAKYFNWESNEPDPESKKNCMEVFKEDGKIVFASELCELKRNFVCENDLPKINMHCVKYHPDY